MFVQAAANHSGRLFFFFLTQLSLSCQAQRAEGVKMLQKAKKLGIIYMGEPSESYNEDESLSFLTTEE